METKKLSTTHPIAGLENLTLGDFWSWAYSDVLNNRNRSILAEFLVAAALDLLDTPRVEWDAVDLCYHDKSIEVKSAAYVQSWAQGKRSEIRFDIGKKRGWNARTNTYAADPMRNADCNVRELSAAIEGRIGTFGQAESVGRSPSGELNRTGQHEEKNSSTASAIAPSGLNDVAASPLLGKNESPSCPKCGQPMMLRTVMREGPHKGKQFWGCPDFPRCRGVREYVLEGK